MKQLTQIYETLNKAYGKQGWWPLSKGKLHSKHHNGAPKNNIDRVEICVGAILTQNTAWKNVEKALYNLNKEKLLHPEKINKINVNKLARLIQPAGYYNQKAEKLKTIADFFVKNPGILKTRNIEELRKTLLQIKGIGPETADSIILYAAEFPVFVIDAYTKRIFSRLGHCNENIKYEELQELFHRNLPKNTEMFKNYHALLVAHAKNNCRKKPVCKGCVLRKKCKYPLFSDK